MKISEYENELKSSGFVGKILENEMMKNHTTMKVGGKADLFLLPEDENSLICAINLASESKIPFYVVGGGSNLIFDDGGFRGIVVCTEGLRNVVIETVGRASPLTPVEMTSNNIDGGFDNAQPTQTFLKCGAGEKSSDVSEFCSKNLLSGFESFAGLPGSVGGAVFMNARCYGDEFSNHVRNVRYLDLEDLKVKNYDFDRSDWSYKKSPFQDGKKIILDVVLSGFKKLEKDSDEAKKSEETAAKNLENRRSKGHFDFPSAGSVFKNNHGFGKPSGAIIDECGLKGFGIGGAQVAPWHGNFIINKGNATASDIKNLVQEIQEKVKEKTGFNLESEVIFV